MTQCIERVLGLAVCLCLSVVSLAVSAEEILPRPEGSVAQKLGRTPAESDPARWPQVPQAPAGAPNVLLILTDDVGFGSSSAFGGLIPTPTLERLAASGLRYNQFNTTAICSPTRAALLTGREPHSIGVGNVTNLSQGYEGYTSVIPKSAGMIAETLRLNGYNTSAFGKWHLVPKWEESPLGPFDRWPTGQGFSYYYGFLDGDTNQFAPALFENTLPVTPSANQPNYILDSDLADHAIHWLRTQHDLAPGSPFFLYYATGSAHSPHHAPKEWLAKFRGKFDQGWDATRDQIFARQKALGIIPATARLTPRPAFLPAWSSLPPDRKRVYSRMMEAYAAALAFSDHEIGRVIDSLRENGEIDNTLIIFIEGDNGSSAEGGKQGLLREESMINGVDEDFEYILKHVDDIGGPRAQNHYPAAWAWAMDTPFQYYKQVASHFGGIRNGMVVSWPSRIKHVGEVRPQIHYVADVVPTILEATSIRQPTVLNGIAQKPLDGVSFYYTFDHPLEPSRRHTQVFEMMQNLGIYHEGWWAGTRPTAAPWDIVAKVNRADLATREWELYNIAADYSQADNLAKTDPVKLEEMKNLFFAEAGKYKILPIHSIGDGIEGRPSPTAGRNFFTFHAGETRIPESAAPRTIGRSYTITADVVIPAGGANGVLITHGGGGGGYAFYLKDGYPVFHYNAINERQYNVRSADRLTPGAHKLVANFAADSVAPGTGGVVTLLSDGREIAKGRIEHTLATWISLSDGLDVGEDTLTPINDDYTIAESKFTGELKLVTIELK